MDAIVVHRVLSDPEASIDSDYIAAIGKGVQILLLDVIMRRAKT